MLLKVHDELVFEVPADELSEARVLIEREMTQAADLHCGLAVEMHSGANWVEPTREELESIFLGARASSIQDSLYRAIMLDPRIVLLATSRSLANNRSLATSHTTT